MKAIIHHQFGSPDVLNLEEVPKPLPGDHDVLVKVQSSSVNFANPAMVRGKPFLIRLMGAGLQTPKIKIPGGDIAGVVEAVGENVNLFKPGDEVYGDMADHGFGAYAEYISAPESELAHKPVNLTFGETAATAQAAVVALQGLRKGGIQSGQHVLVVGASGGIGTFAVQIAKAFGAKVTGVCSSKNLDLVKSIGADFVIDYTKDDFARNGIPYDLVLGTAGYRSIYDFKRALGPTGVYIMTGGSMSQIFQAMAGPLVSMGSSKRMENLSAKSNQADLVYVKELIESGKVIPIIDREYPLSEVPDAFRYYEQGRTRGKIVINI